MNMKHEHFSQFSYTLLNFTKLQDIWNNLDPQFRDIHVKVPEFIQSVRLSRAKSLECPKKKNWLKWTLGGGKDSVDKNAIHSVAVYHEQSPTG